MKILSFNSEITFDDVLILPDFSSFPVKKDFESTCLKSKVSRNIELDIPLLSSPMPGVTEAKMAIALGKVGGMGFVHCFQSFERQLEQIRKVKKTGVKVAASVADLSKNGLSHVGKLLNFGVDLVSIESAHAYNRQTIKFLKDVKKKFPKAEVSAALVVTAEATRELIRAGADSIRVGIGGGSHCTTRLVTSIGRPQLSAVQACVAEAKKHKVPIISDTGIKYPGDIAKAIVFGAETVMVGGLLAGTDEAPGKIVFRKGIKYKYSWGMCTEMAMRNSRPRSDLVKILKLIQSMFVYKPKEARLFEEGVGDYVRYKGSVDKVIRELVLGTKRAMWYVGAENLNQLRKKAKVVVVSANTLSENIPRLSQLYE